MTEDTYHENGWDFIKEFKNKPYPVSIIMGDHLFLDMGNHINRKWTAEVPRASFAPVEEAGHLPWIDQPENLSFAIGKNLNDWVPNRKKSMLTGEVSPALEAF